MTNLDSLLKSKDSTLPTKWYSQNYGLSSSHVQLWELDHKEGECWRIDAFKPWCWRGLLWVLWTVRRSNQSILKESNLKYSSEGLMLSWSSNTMATWGEEPTQWKRPWCCESLRAGEEDEMVAWCHWCTGHELGLAMVDDEGQGSLACCSPWDHKVLDTTWQLNNKDIFFSY